jgi:hypothetical protein
MSKTLEMKVVDLRAGPYYQLGTVPRACDMFRAYEGMEVR